MQSLVELIKGVSKAALLGALGAAFLWKHRDDFLALTRMDIGAALGDGVSLTLSLLAWMVGGLIVIAAIDAPYQRSEEHTSELQSLIRLSYAEFCLKQNTRTLTET